MHLAIPILVGVLSSLITVVAFVLFLRRLRPRLEISPVIARSKTSKGRVIYKIKVVNKSRRSIIKLEAQLHLLNPATTSRGAMLKAIEIRLRRSGLMEISSFDRSDKEANYAYRFVTHEDLDEMWKDDGYSYLKFRIFALDYFSGYGKVFMHEYPVKKEAFMNGDFEYGDSMEIKEGISHESGDDSAGE